MVFRASPRPRPIRPLPKPPTRERPQIWGANIVFKKKQLSVSLGQILSYIFFFSLLRRPKELSVWVLIKVSVYFRIWLLFGTIHGFCCIFWYYLWVLLCFLVLFIDPVALSGIIYGFHFTI